jgi:hypothetical protein
MKSTKNFELSALGHRVLAVEILTTMLRMAAYARFRHLKETEEKDCSAQIGDSTGLSRSAITLIGNERCAKGKSPWKKKSDHIGEPLRSPSRRRRQNYLHVATL